MKKGFKSGFVSIIGRPNVGKSTLMNNLVGQKIAIMSDKAQTTRNKIKAILTNEDFQVIFIDTPGMHKPKSKLGEYMVKSANTTLNETDIVLFLIEPDTKIGKGDSYILEKLSTVKTPKFLIINKVDTVDKEKILQVIDLYKKYEFSEIIPLSALNSDNLSELNKSILKYLPEGPKYFPEDMVTDEIEKQIVSEIIREKALHLLDEEIPHGIAVEVTSMKMFNDCMNVEATIFCERESHKGIVIGKKGAKLKEIGKRSRIDIENLGMRDLGMRRK